MKSFIAGVIALFVTTFSFANDLGRLDIDEQSYVVFTDESCQMESFRPITAKGFIVKYNNPNGVVNGCYQIMGSIMLQGKTSDLLMAVFEDGDMGVYDPYEVKPITHI